MIDRSHELPPARQAKALGLSRGSVYCLAHPVSEADLALMRRIDALHLAHPFAGSRMLQKLLKAEGREGGRLHVSTLMKRSRDRRAMYGWLLPGKGCVKFLTCWSEAAMYPASRCVCRCDARHDGVCRDRGPTQWRALRRAWRDTG
jgi:hypothetical protein